MLKDRVPTESPAAPAPSRPARLARLRTWLARRALGIVLVAAYVWSFPYFEQIHSANELPRIWLAQAIVDEGRFAVDTGVRTLGGPVADVSELDRPATPGTSAKGKYYSNKAPGMSLLAVPAYAVLRLFGRPTMRATTFWLRLTASTLPQLLFLWLLAWWLSKVCADQVARRVALVGYALGTMAFTYGVTLFSHQLAAGFAMASFIVASMWARGVLRERWLPAAGAAAGMALLCDYQAVFLCVPVALYLAWRGRGVWPRLRALALAGAGAVGPVLVLLAYHQACFGSPFRTGYNASKTFAHLHSQGFLGLVWPPMKAAFVGSFFTPDNGLFVLSPVLLLALPGMVWLCRRRETRAEGVIAVSAFVIGAWFVSSIAMWRGGWNVGPRYIAAALPFLVWPVAEALAWARVQRLPLAWVGGVALVGVSLVVYGVLTPMYPHLPSGQFHPVFVNPLYDVGFWLLGRGYAPYNAGWAVGLGGVWGMLPYFALVAGALALALGQGEPGERRMWRWHAAGALGAAVLVGLYALWPQGRGAHMDCNGGRIAPGERPCIERMAAKYEPPRP